MVELFHAILYGKQYFSPEDAPQQRSPDLSRFPKRHIMVLTHYGGINQMPFKLSKRSILFFTTCSSLIICTVAFASELDSAPLLNFLSDASKNQITQAGFFFTAAAWIHSGRVKKEIKENFKALTLSIDHVADAFKEDLKRHGDRLDNLSFRVTHLESNKTKGE